MATPQAQTERVTYLTNAKQKAALEAFAKARGESVGSVLRDAVAEYMAQPSKQEMDELAAILAEVTAAVPEMRASLRRSVATIEQSRAAIDRKMRAAGLRP
jgi:hypothetical protein